VEGRRCCRVSYEALPVVPEVDFSKIKLEKTGCETDDESVQSMTSHAELQRTMTARRDQSQRRRPSNFDFLGKLMANRLKAALLRSRP
jgi:trigger factor